MADKKISELAASTVLVGTDLVPIVSGGVNKKIQATDFAGQLPKVKNNGTLVSNVITATTTEIPLTGQLVVLSLPTHSIGAGISGQEISLIGSGTNSVSLTGAGTLTTINFPAAGQTATIVYVGSAWYVKQHFSVTFA